MKGERILPSVQVQMQCSSMTAAETPAPAETGLQPAHRQLEAAETGLLPTGRQLGAAEVGLLPAQKQLEAAEAGLLPTGR